MGNEWLLTDRELQQEFERLKETCRDDAIVWFWAKQVSQAQAKKLVEWIESEILSLKGSADLAASAATAHNKWQALRKEVGL